MKLATLILPALAGCVIGTWGTSRAVAQRRAPVTVTRLYAGPDGQARAETVELSLRPFARRPGLDTSDPRPVSTAQFVRWPSGYVLDWHTAERRQFVVTVAGRAEVELAGGHKLQLIPGQVVLAEDVTGKGHITRVVGPEDLVLFIVPFAAQ